MITLGWVFVLTAFLLARGVTKGRTVTDFPKDIGDMFVAAVTGNSGAVSEVLARTGDSNTPTQVQVADGPTGSVPNNTPGGLANLGAVVLQEAKKIGKEAGNKYVWGSTGPNGYDCSGLVWRAMKNTGVYTGPRFVTTTFAVMCRKAATKTSTPQVGDIVVWSGHMGIVDGPGTMFSALNKKYGIVHSPLGWGGSSAPTYYSLGSSQAPPATKAAPPGTIFGPPVSAGTAPRPHTTPRTAPGGSVIPGIFP